MRFHFPYNIISPFWRWALFLVLLPILELFLLIHVFHLFFTLLSMLISGLVGMFIAQREGLHCWRDLHLQLDSGNVPISPMIHGILILAGAFLMVLPGFLSSLIGLLLLFRLPRTLVGSYLEVHFNAYRLQSQRRKDSSSETIDV